MADLYPYACGWRVSFNQRTPTECDKCVRIFRNECLNFNQRTPVECDGHHQAVSSSYGLVLCEFIAKIWGFGYFFGSRVSVFSCVTKPRLNEKGSFIRIVGIIMTNGFNTVLPIFSKSIKTNAI